MDDKSLSVREPTNGVMILFIQQDGHEALGEDILTVIIPTILVLLCFAVVGMDADANFRLCHRSDRTHPTNFFNHGAHGIKILAAVVTTRNNNNPSCEMSRDRDTNKVITKAKILVVRQGTFSNRALREHTVERLP